MIGPTVHTPYWYYEGSVDMTSKDYLPYLVLALFMLSTLNILPLLSLTLYPFTFFQRFLDHCLNQKCKLALKIYMDTFHGCYEDTTHDYRHFAALYLAVRFLNLLLISMFNYELYFLAASLLFAFILALMLNFSHTNARGATQWTLLCCWQLLLHTYQHLCSPEMYSFLSG